MRENLKIRRLLSLLRLVHVALQALLSLNFRLAKQLIKGLNQDPAATDLPPWEIAPFDFKSDWLGKPDHDGQVVDWYSSQEGRRRIRRKVDEP